MKLRSGFISNSSSSSFIITSKEPLTVEYLIKMSKIDENFPLYKFIVNVFEVIVDCSMELKTVDDLLKNYCYSTVEELIEDRCLGKQEAINFFEKKHHLYTGSFSSEDRSLEAGLCETDFDINTEDFYFNQRGGY